MLLENGLPVGKAEFGIMEIATMSITRTTLALAGMCAAVGLGMQAHAQQAAAPAADAQAKQGKTAVAKMSPTQGNNARGEITFVQTPTGVHVTGSFTGIAYGDHGFHIHEKGDCSAPDGASAGGHFNPMTMKHGARDAQERHAGDLGNLKADPYGMARLDITDDKLSLEGPNSIIGKAVIIHEKADDFQTQPTGNAGGRISCGVIEAKVPGTSPSSK
jgi:superoxide dismutase, Cu-Zn family